MSTPRTVDATRVLPPEPISDLASYVARGGGKGRDAARKLGPDGVIEHLAASGLRGRGGAGFPTSVKWAAVLTHESTFLPATVVVNAAEGEPGSFKDRAILRRNVYAVLEGALIAAATVEADRVVVALKSSFTEERDLVHHAIEEVRRAGWADDVELIAFGGPAEYLYGEETALLEALEGRPPFPRVAPPYRHGVDEVGPDGSSEAAQVVMAEGTAAPPTLVNNLETIANVPGILAYGPAWFRELGTDDSPGTIVCTVSGASRRDGVAEVPMGTSLRDIIDDVGGGARADRRVVAVMSGVANPLVPADLLDTPASHEGMQEIGSGLGAAGFIVFDDTTDFAALAHAVSRFLAVESCGQCTPCKQDGLALVGVLDRIRRSDAHELDLLAVDDHLGTIADGARCSLASQQQRVIGSIGQLFGDQLRAHVTGARASAASMLVAPIVRIDHDTAVLDESQRTKQPDWSHDEVTSGASPAERLATVSPDAERLAP